MGGGVSGDISSVTSQSSPSASDWGLINSQEPVWIVAVKISRNLFSVLVNLE